MSHRRAEIKSKMLMLFHNILFCVGSFGSFRSYSFTLHPDKRVACRVSQRELFMRKTVTDFFFVRLHLRHCLHGVYPALHLFRPLACPSLCQCCRHGVMGHNFRLTSIVIGSELLHRQKRFMCALHVTLCGVAVEMWRRGGECGVMR